MPRTKSEPTHPWAFVRRFRRGGFGWRSSVAVPAVRTAVAEIRKVAKHDPILGAEGAIKLIERLSPALEQVDSSSGAIGAAVNGALEVLAEIVGSAPLDPNARAKALERIWQARQDDTIPYLELVDELWGTYCGSPQIAAIWADEHLWILQHAVRDGYIAGSIAVLSALSAAARHEEILSLLEPMKRPSWTYRQWGFKALVALGRPGEAFRYAEASRGINEHGIDAACEQLLLASGMEEEAYRRYGRAAAPRHATNLATFRAMRKKYPRIDPVLLLGDLAAADPGREGRWFAAAVSAELYDVALQLARTSPTDPKTLTRAARDHLARDPAFTLARQNSHSPRSPQATDSKSPRST